jgi:hypothetical protein
MHRRCWLGVPKVVSFAPCAEGFGVLRLWLSSVKIKKL